MYDCFGLHVLMAFDPLFERLFVRISMVVLI